MKRTLLAAMTLACIASPASAITVWQGDLFVTAVVGGAACTAVNMAKGNYARGIFRPKNVADNGTSDLLSWHFAGSSGQVVPTGGSLNGATKGIVRIIYGSAGFNQFNNWTLSGADVTPDAPTAANQTVDIQVTIQDIYSKNPTTPSNCDVTFKGTLAKKP